MCDQDQDQPFVAPGFDANLHSCQVCNDTGISQETASYCTACRMGKRIEQLDQFAEQLKGHGFTEAMRIVYRTTQRTEKAIAAADKALMMAKQKAQIEKVQIPDEQSLVDIYDKAIDDSKSWKKHSVGLDAVFKAGILSAMKNNKKIEMLKPVACAWIENYMSQVKFGKIDVDQLKKAGADKHSLKLYLIDESIFYASSVSKQG